MDVYYYVRPVPTSGLAVASLVFGILGLLFGYCLCGIPSVLAVLLGHAALLDTRDGRRQGRGLAVAGLILGYVLVLPMLLASVWIVPGIFE